MTTLVHRALIVLRDWFLLQVLPKLRVPYWTCCFITRKQREAVFAVIKAGDIALTWSPHGVSSCLTVGADHAAICIGRHPTYAVFAEMTADDCNPVTFYTLCKYARRVVIVRPKPMVPDTDYDHDYATKMVAECERRRAEGVLYDTMHNVGNRKLNCAELPVVCDVSARLQVKPGRVWFSKRRFIAPRHIRNAEGAYELADTKQIPRR